MSREESTRLGSGAEGLRELGVFGGVIAGIGEDYVNGDGFGVRCRHQAQGLGEGPADAAHAAAFRQRRLVNPQNDRLRLPGGRLVQAEHEIVGRIVDGRTKQAPTAQHGDDEGRREQTDVRSRTFPAALLCA